MTIPKDPERCLLKLPDLERFLPRGIQGMTMREHLAGLALSGMLANPARLLNPDPNTTLHPRRRRACGGFRRRSARRAGQVGTLRMTDNLPERVELGSDVDERGGEIDIPQLFERALEVEHGADAIDKLITLKLKMEALHAKRVFNEALREFQMQCPQIPKTGEFRATDKDGRAIFTTAYARLEEDIEPTIQPLLNELGFNYGFSQSKQGNDVTATVTLRHVSGHEASSSFTGEKENLKIGGANQGIAAGETYAKRRALRNLLALRLDDPKEMGREPAPESLLLVTDHQVADLQLLIEETYPKRAKECIKRLCKNYGVSALAELTHAAFVEAVEVLEERRRSAP